MLLIHSHATTRPGSSGEAHVLRRSEKLSTNGASTCSLLCQSVSSSLKAKMAFAGHQHRSRGSDPVVAEHGITVGREAKHGVARHRELGTGATNLLPVVGAAEMAEKAAGLRVRRDRPEVRVDVTGGTSYPCPVAPDAVVAEAACLSVSAVDGVARHRKLRARTADELPVAGAAEMAKEVPVLGVGCE